MWWWKMFNKKFKELRMFIFCVLLFLTFTTVALICFINKDVKTDSREVEEKDIFVATHGFNVDHSDYIDDAIKNGAAAVVTDVPVLSA